jgi:mono/diheme cytochrome c family protein
VKARARATAAAIAAAAALGGLGACDWSAQRMVDQERCERDEPTRLFPDGNCDRVPPPGAVEWRGRAPGGGPSGPSATPAATTPRPALSRTLLERGRNRFEIFCAPCHGLVGDGRSQVAENMLLRPPPSLHETRIVNLDDAKLYDVVSGGYGLMPAYRAQLAPADRWAVVAYVRALERSQDVALDQLPPGVREEAERWLR